LDVILPLLQTATEVSSQEDSIARIIDTLIFIKLQKYQKTIKNTSLDCCINITVAHRIIVRASI
jgi:hypothetical protein